MTMTLREIAESVQSDIGGDAPAAYRKRIERSQPAMEAVRDIAIMIEAYRDGSRRAGFELGEALTTNDLARFASGAIIDREMQQNYDALPTQWPKFLSPTTVGDFKPKYMSSLELGAQVFKDVPERTPYPVASEPELAEYPITAKKTGLLWGFSFEAGINDDLDQLLLVPRQFPQMAVDTEDDRGLRLLINLETGALNTAFFKVANANIGTLVLNATNLQTIYTQLTTKRDPQSGGIIPAGRLQLVVGPALQFAAERILNTAVVRTTVGGVETEEPNPLRGKFDLVVNEKQLGSSWIVMPKPGTSRRQPFWFARLRGFEQPDFRYKSDQGRSISGGDVSVTSGSFDDDTIWYRGRHIMGVAHGDPVLTYGSDNTGA